MVEENEHEKKISLLIEDLASLEGYIHDLFVFAPLPICFIIPHGVILEANPAFEKISNLPITEIIGAPIINFFKKDEIDALQGETLKNKSVAGKEMVFLPGRENQLMIQAFTRVRENETGEAVGYFLSIFDLTQIKETERNIKQSQRALLNILEDTEEARTAIEEEKNKTTAIINNFTDGLLVFDIDNRLSSINPQAEILFDIKARDIAGRSYEELLTFPTLQSLMSLMGEKMEGIFRKELPLRENLVLEVSTVSIIKEEEKAGTLIILHDITREKTIERMKTEFVSLAAHQLRTPLSAIKWTLRMLLDGDLGEITEEQRNFIEKSYSSNERMIDLINDLLNVTRIEEGRYLYRPILTDIESIVQFVINSYKEEIERKKIKFELEKPEKKLPRALLDVEKMRLAFQNILDNAIRYTRPGGKVTVSIKYANKEIEISVADTGVGIPKDQQGRIFTKFFRGANAIRMETEGSGLGLFIAKNIIEVHGGRIWFESEENKGTTLYFIVPVKEEFEKFIEGF